MYTRRSPDVRLIRQKDVKPTKLKLLKELKEDMDKDRKGSYE